jgi:hypothetical protein
MPVRYDVIELKADVTAEGWIIDKPVITRAGIFKYHDSKGKVVREYRPEDEVFSADSLNSLRAIPITDGHNGILTIDSNLDGIIVGNVMSSGEKLNENNVVADIVIHNVKKIGNKRDLSLGYVCKIDETPGEYNGQPYDCIQRGIKYNHLAVVHKGRAGNARIRLDSEDRSSFPTEDDMAEVTLGKVRFDNGLEYAAANEVVVKFKEMLEEIVSLKTRADKADAQVDVAKAALVTAKQEQENAVKLANSSARSRVKLEDKAEQLSIKFDSNASDRSIKELIIKKLGNDLDFTDRSDDYVDSAFDITIANADNKNTKTADQKTKTVTKQDTSNSGTSSIDARARMIARIRGEKEAA